MGYALAARHCLRLSFETRQPDSCPEFVKWSSPMPVLADRQSQLLIDGKLVAGGGGAFETVNPATEEVLGVAADANTEDMGNAIEAARRAFDDTDWSTNTALRVRCLRQLRDALR